MTQLVLPQHANVHGTVLGGTVMHWIDLAAAVVANRHSRRPVVTAAIDEMSFLAPIQVGQLALLHARHHAGGHGAAWRSASTWSPRTC